MILIFGSVANPAVAYVCARLVERGETPALLDIRRTCFGAASGRWSVGNRSSRGYIRFEDGLTVDMAEVRGIYFHQLDAERELQQSRSDVHRYEALCSLLNTTAAEVINKPSANAWARTKPLQFERFVAEGFPVPRTLITRCASSAREFHRRCEGKVVVKGISGQRTMVQWLDEGLLKRFEDSDACPVLLQEYIPGCDIRFHVVGERVFATSIRSPDLDYRYGRKEIEPVRVGGATKTRALRVAQSMGLRMCSVDVRENPDGEYFGLEVNPNPGFTYYQAITGQRIGEALVDLLVGGPTGKPEPRPGGMNTKVESTSEA